MLWCNYCDSRLGRIPIEFSDNCPVLLLIEAENNILKQKPQIYRYTNNLLIKKNSSLIDGRCSPLQSLFKSYRWKCQTIPSDTFLLFIYSQGNLNLKEALCFEFPLYSIEITPLYLFYFICLAFVSNDLTADRLSFLFIYGISSRSE